MKKHIDCNFQRTIVLVLGLLFFLPAQVYSQVALERHSNEVYHYLARMAQKGIISFDDIILPLSKNKIKNELDSVRSKSALLTKVEKSELLFYTKEFSENNFEKRLTFQKGSFSLSVNPLVTINRFNREGKSFMQTSGGVQFYGNASSKIGFQFSFLDYTEKGQGIQFVRNRLIDGSSTGIISYDTFNRKRINYAEIRTSISYQFKKGQLSIGQDYLNFGYGENGRIVLGDKAPTYPFIRWDYQLLKGIKFNFIHSWLQSGLVDSSRSYTIPGGGFGGIREVDISKYMAIHSLDFTIKKGLVFTVGESMIYNDKLNVGYFIPIMFFKAFDNYSNRGSIVKGSNGQFFLQLNARNQIPKTHFYAALLVDEIKISKIFDKKAARNQLGYTVGGSITDLGVSYLTAGAEYTRIRPFVYSNFLPAQNYTSSGYSIGDWMGNNSDRIILFLKYTPIPKLKLLARYQQIRKGGLGTIDQQYNQQPQPDFLFDFQTTQKDIFLQAKYEWLHRFCFNVTYNRYFKSATFSSIGFTFGL